MRRDDVNTSACGAAAKAGFARELARRTKEIAIVADSQVCAPLEPTLQALSATIAVAEPTVRAGETVLHVHGDNGSAELVCACLMAQLYQLSADEGLARVSAYAALRDTTHVGALASLTDTQKQLCRDLVRIRRASDCADE